MNLSNKFAYSIDELPDTAPVGKTKIYANINSGKLKARKLDGRTIVLHDDWMDFLRSLPVVEVHNA